jgi:proline iminopeptidase
MRISAILLAAAACSSREARVAADTTLPAGALPVGEARLAVPGGNIWYKVSGAGTGTPVILLHGGPGLNSYYLKPLEALGADRPVVRYDQLGGGKSDRISDTTMFTIAHFVAELDRLRAHLGYERVHLVGHSWGTILGLEYYAAHSDRVASLTLASPALNMPAWERNTRRLLKTLPDSTQRIIREAEQAGTFDSPAYQAANGEFYARYVFLRPVPADLDSSLTQMNQAIYGYMQGPSEFTITGTLKAYDGTPRLKSVRVPVLFTVGEFDEADPATVRRHASLTPGAEVVVIDSAAHITTWDNPDATLTAIRSFLTRSEAGRRP